jgi:hypothetical protein
LAAVLHSGPPRKDIVVEVVRCEREGGIFDRRGGKCTIQDARL